MAILTGNNGVVKLDASVGGAVATIAAVRTFSVELTRDTIETSTIDGGRSNGLGGLRSLSLLLISLDGTGGGLLNRLRSLESFFVVIGEGSKHSLSGCHSNYHKNKLGYLVSNRKCIITSC
jgi:hypothetical protein